MNGSWKIARFAGIDVHVHWTFLLLMGAVFVSSLLEGATAYAALGSVLFIVSLFACVVLHEFGHALTARQFGIRTRDITLLPIGGVARLERMPKNPWQEFLVAVAGPAVNVVIAGGILLLLLFLGGLDQLLHVEALGPSFFGSSFLIQLMFVNVFLVFFNMLPAFPMDGGRVLRAVLAMGMPYVRATRWAVRVGQVMAALFILGGLLAGHWMLALVGLFILFAAHGEGRQAELEASLEGVPVHRAMATRFYSLDVRAPLAEASYLSRSGQEDFPVFDGEWFVGMLYRDDLEAALARGEPLFVGDVVRKDVPALSPYDTLTDALSVISSAGVSALPVIQRGRMPGEPGRLVGLLTQSSIHWWQAMQARPRPQSDFYPRQSVRVAG